MSSKSAFEALAKLRKQEPDFKDFSGYYKETGEDANHRGAAILLATNVENALDYAMEGYFVRKRLDILFGQDKPLGSFRNKIAVAYALNIFGDEMFHNLECIREIRNTFAHCKISIDFETVQIKQVCDIMIPLMINPPYRLGAEKEDIASLSGFPRFRAITERVTHNLGLMFTKAPLLITRESYDEALKNGRNLHANYFYLEAKARPLP